MRGALRRDACAAQSFRPDVIAFFIAFRYRFRHSVRCF